MISTLLYHACSLALLVFVIIRLKDILIASINTAKNTEEGKKKTPTTQSPSHYKFGEFPSRDLVIYLRVCDKIMYNFIYYWDIMHAVCSLVFCLFLT